MWAKKRMQPSRKQVEEEKAEGYRKWGRRWKGKIEIKKGKSRKGTEKWKKNWRKDAREKKGKVESERENKGSCRRMEKEKESLI
jgi:hypothetical protein